MDNLTNKVKETKKFDLGKRKFQKKVKNFHFINIKITWKVQKRKIFQTIKKKKLKSTNISYRKFSIILKLKIIQNHKKKLIIKFIKTKYNRNISLLKIKLNIIKPNNNNKSMNNVNNKEKSNEKFNYKTEKS